jgi:pyridoxamine 5'-phosphate oxidase
MRYEYTKGELRKKDLDPNPFKQFELWFSEAQAAASDADAMALATVNEQGRPSCRMVLLKGWDERGFFFFTDYRSRKGQDLEIRPHAAATFFWKELERQVCIRGSVEKLTASESEQYFSSRPRGSQISVWASRQDEPLTSREILEERYASFEEEFKDRPIPRPPYWGGFRIIASRMEFWQGRANRLHDRFSYTLTPESLWQIERLSP